MALLNDTYSHRVVKVAVERPVRIDLICHVETDAIRVFCGQSVSHQKLSSRSGSCSVR